VKLTRRQALAGAAAGAFGAAGIYELVDRFAGDSPRREAAGPLPPEQHLLDGQRLITDNGVDVILPPLHHQVVTAKVKLGKRDLRDARRVLEVNVLGAMIVLAAAARAMIDGGAGGAIVNIASMAGVSGAPNMPAYSASKAAVIGLTKAAAKDLAPHGIRVNAVSPAFIGPGRMWDTQVARQAAAGSQYYASDPEAVAAQMIELVPMRRYGSVHEVANVVAFLLSDDASYVNGVNLEVSGGSV